MKFYVKNNFIYNGIRKVKDEIIEVNPEKINDLQKADVLGAPVKETKIEAEVIKPVENEMLSSDRGTVLDTSHFPIPKLRTKSIKKKGKK